MSDSDLQATQNYINSIDFSPIVYRIMKDKGWSRRRVLKAIEEYKRFLFLQKKYDGKQMLVPSLRIDEIWHNHILFTKQYHEDSLQLFGRYLHHQPTTELGKYKLSHSDNEKAADETEKLYLQEYGEYIYGKPIYYPAILEPFVKLLFSLKIMHRIFA